ncbi:serine beta-lactamase-like protein LACTB, mitochondrial isoform X2 [Boleophthalmus pectinirostris]|uniref:serine beta-lactamase-like protein LACTB, mitochondrial isoform X2 n=1 Tax=Boleophthalmus pectinirostris TaxID=150288 RepID=UPI00242D1276|nr:serine beta-lactamase-like protein LACTB, mitochondrial isoform X2 [Boleophthalmus pectinirostris]
MALHILHQCSRGFSPARVCVRFSGLSARAQPHLQRVHRFIHRTSHGSGESSSSSRLWLYGLYGLGLGGAVTFAVALKSRRDLAESPGDCERTDAAGYRGAVETSRELLQRIQAEVGAPGLVVGVSVDGVQVWSEGIGLADLENRVPCTPDTVMRIASVSKALTATAAARLCQEGKLKLDEPVQKYVPEFPKKQFEGKEVTITPRMLMSHVSGIRHYEKDGKKVRRELEKPLEERTSEFEPEFDEYYLKDRYNSVIDSLNFFKDDPLIFKPGTTYLYSSHAFILLSAVMERAGAVPYLDQMGAMFRDLGMFHTVPDKNDPLIYHRSRFYHLNKKRRVVNTPYVDNSCKWGSGGFLSTAGDLLRFGNALLYSYQITKLKDTEGMLPGFLKPNTARELWTPVTKTEGSWDKDGQYAQGWLVVEEEQKYGQCRKRRHYVSHTGAAVGASSVLLVLPAEKLEQKKQLPQGVVVSIIMNMQFVYLYETAQAIAHEFERARLQKM